MAKIEPANLLLTDKDGNTGLVKSLTNKDITTLKGVVTNVDYIKDYMTTNNITLPVQGDIRLTATDEEGNNDKTLLGTSIGILQWNNQNLVRSVNGLIADAYGNVNVKVFELQRDVQKSFTGTLSATLTNTDNTTTTKTVTKSYNKYSNTSHTNSVVPQGIIFQNNDIFTYGVTFNKTPTVSTSNSSYFRVSSVTTTNATISLYINRKHVSEMLADNRPAGSATATGQIISSKVVSKTVSKTVNYGVTYKDVPTISNVVGCTVTDIGTTACTVTTTLSTTLSSGQSATLKSDFSFDVIGDAIISSED